MAAEVNLSLIIGLLTLSIATASNIAIYGGAGFGSHFAVAASLGEELVRRGHNVTAIIGGEAVAVSQDERYSKLFNFAVTNRRFTDAEIQEKLDFVARAAVSGNFFGEMMKHMDVMREELLKDCDSLLLDDGFLSRLVDANLDLFIIDPYFGCSSFIPHLLEKPFILMLPTSFNEFVGEIIGGSTTNVASRPGFGSGLPPRMTLLQRLHNFLKVKIIPSFVAMVMKGSEEYFSLRNLFQGLSGVEMMRKAELILVNMDFAVEFPFPISPNIIPVGGITTRPSKPLQQDLEDFVQSSGEDGVIIFSMGSYATFMKEELISDFTTAFSRLPQKVVWKTTKGLPDGTDQAKIKAMPWIPQNDLLAHEKTKLIIFQGGNNGFYEVVYHGVPCVVIPLLEDQFDIASRVTHHGMGVQLDYHTLNADKIEEAIKTVLTEKSYAENAAKISSRYRHDPIRPVEKAAFWVEYVLQHGGSHLRSVAGELTWYQYHSVDVIIFLAVILILMLICLFFVLRLAWKCACNGFHKCEILGENKKKN